MPPWRWWQPLQPWQWWQWWQWRPQPSAASPPSALPCTQERQRATAAPSRPLGPLGAASAGTAGPPAAISSSMSRAASSTVPGRPNRRCRTPVAGVRSESSGPWCSAGWGVCGACLARRSGRKGFKCVRDGGAHAAHLRPAGPSLEHRAAPKHPAQHSTHFAHPHVAPGDARRRGLRERDLQTRHGSGAAPAAAPRRQHLGCQGVQLRLHGLCSLAGGRRGQAKGPAAAAQQRGRRHDLDLAHNRHNIAAAVNHRHRAAAHCHHLVAAGGARRVRVGVVHLRSVHVGNREGEVKQRAGGSCSKAHAAAQPGPGWPRSRVPDAGAASGRRAGYRDRHPCASTTGPTDSVSAQARPHKRRAPVGAARGSQFAQPCPPRRPGSRRSGWPSPAEAPGAPGAPRPAAEPRGAAAGLRTCSSVCF